jgi:hypothetical protein
MRTKQGVRYVSSDFKPKASDAKFREKPFSGSAGVSCRGAASNINRRT